MSRDLIRLMNVLFTPAVEVCRDGPWCPAVDVYRTRRGWIVKYEVAGVRAEDLDVEVLGSRLTVRGVRRDSINEPGAYHLMEIAYSSFERSVELPCDLRQADVSTELRDGMLLVHIAPASEVQP
jgi:HSP20 family protein